MRDPARIEPFLKLFQTLWEQYPDMSFGQLVMNIVDYLGGVYRERGMWLAEDDEWLTALTTAVFTPGKFRGE